MGSPVIISGEGSKRIRTTSENNSGAFMLRALISPRLSALVLSFLYEPYLNTSLAFAKSQGVSPLPAQVQAQQDQPQSPAAQLQTSSVCDDLLAEHD